MLGLTYRIQGKPEEARVFVNPLSALAPGFLRRLFQVGEPDVAGPPSDMALPSQPDESGAEPLAPADMSAPVPIPERRP